MKNFWAYVSNEKFSIGCTGQTVYVYDENGNELKKFKDIKYGYTPMISPTGKIFVVKSTAGLLAVYSLETLSLIKKFRFSKVDGAQDDNFCFSHDGKYFLNLERQTDPLHSAVSIYDTADFSRIFQLSLDEDTMLDHIEYDQETGAYFVLGFVRGDDGGGFIARFTDGALKDITPITENEHEFYRDYKRLAIMGFTRKAFEWSSLLCDLSDIANKNHTLAKLFHYYHK